jgi:hypothetical protein
MKKTRTWIATAFAANLLLLPLLLATPDEAQANGTSAGWFDCCQESVEEEDFCCDNCCWIVNNCNSSSDCQPG